MYLDVESIVTLNALRRAEIYQEIVGAQRVQYPWTERAQRVPITWRPFRALHAAVASLHGSVPAKQPIS